MDQSLLNDIELDVRELRYWINAASEENQAELQAILKRHILRMHANLDRLSERLGGEPAEESLQPQIMEEECHGVASYPEGNRWNHSLSVNDSFRYLREIFDGDAGCMKRVMDKAGQLGTWEEVLEFLHSQVILDEKEEVTEEFLNFLKSSFNR